MDAGHDQSNLPEHKRLFVDMDGTLAEFKKTDTLEILYERGYFRNLAPIKPVIKAVNELVKSGNMEVFILSSCLSDSLYALEEKNSWLDEYIPKIDKTHRLFPPCGISKIQWLKEQGFTIHKTDYLLDDYSLNLHEWDRYGTGIKMLNGINHTKGTWHGAMASLNNIGDILQALPDKTTMQDRKNRREFPIDNIQPKFEMKQTNRQHVQIPDKSRDLDK